jgi:hypothetical protein
MTRVITAHFGFVPDRDRGACGGRGPEFGK